MGVAGTTGSAKSPFSPEPRNPLIPLKMMALGEAGDPVGKVDGVGETSADPLMVGVMASPGESGIPASNEEVGPTSAKTEKYVTKRTHWIREINLPNFYART